MNAPGSLSPDYSEALLEHFHRPRNVGCFPAGAAGVLTGAAGNRRHGREVRFEIRVAGGRVAECRYQVYGDPATIALCSLLSERLRDLSVAEARTFSTVALADELGLPPVKRAAALVLEDALGAALRSYNSVSQLEPLRA